ncbi:17-beta-hydroxysteroid dehydrogenase 13-like [Centruroides sculpturatus]|uniref:17-beta-hydroxysteroid dehydrogenase 13-like n=1 Tax=Centruroides sculpturatus TaxID=218467 RepID=UPI000C6D2541|nr:17-beta-hydroxysteroid dehydrogenase 13-like [Centruroides sculpturatus]
MGLRDAFALIFEVIDLLFKSLLITIRGLIRFVIPTARKSVNDEIVLITGSAHGLGKELALQFSKLGAIVVLWDINQEWNNAVAKEIKLKSGIAFSYQCDVTDEKQVKILAQRVRREVGDVTILINNAGILQGHPLLSLNNQQIRRTVEVNLLSQFWTVREFLPQMLELEHGHIVAVSSIAGCRGCINMTDYSASKFGICGLMNSLEEELILLKKDHCIHLSTVYPLAMDTGLSQRPLTRFPHILPILKPDYTAAKMIDAILRNKRNIFIPSRIEFIIRISGLFPMKVVQMFQQFMNYAVLSNDKVPTELYSY